ncbi:MAG: branched-chain amino acid transaminase [Candidatus Limnocylindrales bacterium]
MPMPEVDSIWMDGALVPYREAKVHVLTHGLHYGTGVFEGLRGYETSNGTAVFRLADHVKRLFRSARLYHMEIPYTVDDMVAVVETVVRTNRLGACYIRPIVFRGFGDMGINPLELPVSVTVAAWPSWAYFSDEAFAKGIRVKVSSWKRNDNNAIPPAAKGTGQYLNSALAKMEAVMAGYDEAVMLNPEGYVCDGTGENIFAVRGGALLTPPLSAGCLDGITRNSVKTIAHDLGIEVSETNLTRSDLYEADEAFFTGTAAEVTPIRDIDDRLLVHPGLGPVTRRIQETFFAAARGELPAYETWNHRVDDTPPV